MLLLIAAFVWISRRASSLMVSGPRSAFTRARARRVEGEATYTTFADVAGIDDAKDELAEIVDYLRRPQRYRRLGGRVPRGVLLWEHRGRTRRCWRERSRASRACRSSRCRPRSSWR